MLVDMQNYKDLMIDVIKRHKDKSSIEIAEMIVNLTDDYIKCNGFCGKMLPLDSFSKGPNHTNRHGRFTMCKVCHKKYRKMK